MVKCRKKKILKSPQRRVLGPYGLMNHLEMYRIYLIGESLGFDYCVLSHIQGPKLTPTKWPMISYFPFGE